MKKNMAKKIKLILLPYLSARLPKNGVIKAEAKSFFIKFIKQKKSKIKRIQKTATYYPDSIIET